MDMSLIIRLSGELFAMLVFVRTAARRLFTLDGLQDFCIFMVVLEMDWSRAMWMRSLDLCLCQETGACSLTLLVSLA